MRSGIVRVEASLVIKACLKEYYVSESGGRLRKQVIDKILKVATSFGDWEAVLYFCPELKEESRKALNEIEMTSEELQIAYQNSRLNSDVESILLQKLLAQIAIDEWRVIYRMSDSGSKLEKTANFVIKEFEKSEKSGAELTIIP